MRSCSAKTECVLLVCRKCSDKVGGGFGKKGDKRLAKKLRDLGDGRKGRKSDLLVVETDCLKLCPRDAVVVVNAARPGEWLLVPPRTDVGSVATAMGVPVVPSRAPLST